MIGPVSEGRAVNRGVECYVLLLRLLHAIVPRDEHRLRLSVSESLNGILETSELIVHVVGDFKRLVKLRLLLGATLSRLYSRLSVGEPHALVPRLLQNAMDSVSRKDASACQSKCTGTYSSSMASNSSSRSSSTSSAASPSSRLSTLSPSPSSLRRR